MIGGLRKLLRDTRAATALEYGLIVAMIVIAMIGAFTQFANISTGMWNNVSDEVSKKRD